MFIAFWQVLPFREEAEVKKDINVFINFQRTKLPSFPNISIWFILKTFLKFRKFFECSHIPLFSRIFIRSLNAWIESREDWTQANS